MEGRRNLVCFPDCWFCAPAVPVDSTSELFGDSLLVVVIQRRRCHNIHVFLTLTHSLHAKNLPATMDPNNSAPTTWLLRKRCARLCGSFKSAVRICHNKCPYAAKAPALKKELLQIKKLVGEHARIGDEEESPVASAAKAAPAKKPTPKPAAKKKAA